MILYRLAFFIYSEKILRYCLFWYLLFYKLITGWVMNISIHPSSVIGKGMRIQYGFGTVIGADTIIGTHCNIRQLTTIGAKSFENGEFGPSPHIGNFVDIGVNATIIGSIWVGDSVTIGAGSVITKDIEPNSVVIGNPATLLKKKYDLLRPATGPSHAPVIPCEDQE